MSSEKYFTSNKYTTWYFAIIAKATQRTLPDATYTEKHHIIPKSLGGSNDPANIARVTAREHFICHWLLTKMTAGPALQKMSYACKRMMTAPTGSKRYFITGRRYELLKIRLNENLKGRVFTDEWIARLKASAQARAASLSDEERLKRATRLTNQNKARKGIKKPAMTGENNYFYGKKLSGELNGFYGKQHSPETKEKLKQARVYMSCVVCRKTMHGISALTRYHNPCNHQQGEQKFQD